LGLKRLGESGLRHTQQLAEEIQLGIERTLANLATEENRGAIVAPLFRFSLMLNYYINALLGRFAAMLR
jgi:hypothetical protein